MRGLATYYQTLIKQLQIYVMLLMMMVSFQFIWQREKDMSES